jgi:hypothetical protein
MAKEDWQEWIEPWNWTVVPHNTTNGQNISSAACGSNSNALVSFFEDNLISLAQAVILQFISWFFSICGSKPKNLPKSGKFATFTWSLSGGILLTIIFRAGDFALAFVWSRVAGYHDIPWGSVGLLLCARPTIMGFLCFVSLFSDELSTAFAWGDREQVKRFRRRVYGFTQHLKFWKRSKSEYEPKVAEEEAKRILTNMALTIGIGELLLQLLSFYSIWKTVIVGRTRGFYRVSALVPYWRGQPALWMYAGALVHCIFSFISVFALVLAALVHVDIIDGQKWEEKLSLEGRKVEELRRYYVEAEQRRERGQEYDVPTSREVKRTMKMTRTQRLLERSIRGRKNSDPSLMKRVWKRLRGQYEPVPRQATGLNERDLSSTKIGGHPHLAWLRDSSVGIIHSTTTWLQILINDANQDPPAQPSNLCRFLGRTLSRLHLSTVNQTLLNWAERKQERQLRRLQVARAGPDREFFEQLLLERDRRILHGPKKSWWVPSFKRVALLLTLSCVIVNYASQWLFWAGFIESSGER